MNWIRTAVFLTVASVISAVLFWSLQRGLSESWLTVGVHPEVLDELDASLQDQRRLAELDPENETVYRREFERRAELMQRLRVLRHARADVVRRYQQILLAIFGFTVALVIGGWMWRQRRQELRLEALREALTELARGDSEVRVAEAGRSRWRHRVVGRDLIGRIAAMVEETSRVMTSHRRRLKALENLSAWQESARRHAHEMRTPLTAARLELRRLERLLSSDEAHSVSAGVVQELDRLGEFARRFTSFARLPAPRRVRRELGALVRDIAATFEGAWANLHLGVAPCREPLEAEVDGEMLRQVLVNLVDNASLAMAAEARAGTEADRLGAVEIRLHRLGDVVYLDVSDDGPGIDRSVRSRLFEPYTTTRGIGEGMGLGLAICRKILLDHDGELELVDTSERGTTFRLTLPVASESSQEPAQNVPHLEEP
ncbi:MAG: ATP-binding protein [Thermoanaerobaculia bacterium]|nr:ATP-binding protein [Thermoanaerobaculia bacterium]